jgi:undecaprenyl-diphosphatase
VVAVYLGGSALAAAAPTPGGLGALEAGLIAGLTSVGQPAAAAVTAVLVFRLVTYWVPVLPGAASFWALRRAGSL